MTMPPQRDTDKRVTEEIVTTPAVTSATIPVSDAEKLAVAAINRSIHIMTTGGFDPTASLQDEQEQVHPALRSVEFPRWCLKFFGPRGQRGWETWGAPRGVPQSEWRGGFGFRWELAENLSAIVDGGQWMPVNSIACQLFDIPVGYLDPTVGAIARRIGREMLVLTYTSWEVFEHIYGDPADTSGRPEKSGAACRASQERLQWIGEKTLEDSKGLFYAPDSGGIGESALNDGAYAVLNETTERWEEGTPRGR